MYIRLSSPRGSDYGPGLDQVLVQICFSFWSCCWPDSGPDLGQALFLIWSQKTGRPALARARGVRCAGYSARQAALGVQWATAALAFAVSQWAARALPKALFRNRHRQVARKGKCARQSPNARPSKFCKEKCRLVGPNTAAQTEPRPRERQGRSLAAGRRCSNRLPAPVFGRELETLTLAKHHEKKWGKKVGRVVAILPWIDTCRGLSS